MSSVSQWYRPTSLGDLAVFIIFLLCLQWIALVIYRLKFHPLADFPGRWRDKISSWPHVIRCYSGNRHVEELLLHERYGPNSLAFDTVAAHQAINRDRHTNTIKHDWYTLEPAMTGETSVQTAIDFKEHDFRRRVLAPAFAAAALKDYETIIADDVEKFLDIVAGDWNSKDIDGWTSAIDFSEWVTYFGYDFISHLAFGSSIGCLHDDAQRYIPNMVIRLSHFIYYAAYVPFPRFVRWLVSTRIMGYIDPCAADGYRFTERCTQMLAERQEIEAKGGQRDIFHYLIGSEDPETGVGFTEQQLIADTVLLLAAGSDGVSASLAAAVFYLLQCPQTLHKLTLEVREAFSSFDSIKGSKLGQLPYLDAVVNETVRLAPAVPSALPRTVLPGGLRVGDVHVPAGTMVGVSPYCVQHNEEAFAEAFEFRPERWIGNTPEKTASLNRAMVSFGGGRFGCIGRNVAVLSMKLTLAKMLWRYDIRLDSGRSVGAGHADLGMGRHRTDEYQIKDHVVAARAGPSVQFRFADHVE